MQDLPPVDNYSLVFNHMFSYILYIPSVQILQNVEKSLQKQAFATTKNGNQGCDSYR